MKRESVRHIGQKRDLTGAFDRLGQLTLMHCAGSGGSAGQNLGTLGKVTAQFRGVLVIDMLRFIHAKSTDFPALAAAGFVERHEDNLLVIRWTGTSR
jgi:sorbitol-specific phosphotransferase system component IIA